MKKTGMRRFLALLTALCMLLSLAPAAYADGGETAEAAEASAAEKTVFRSNWSGATVVNSGETVHFVLDQFTSGYTGDQIWLAVNAQEHQAIQMSLTGNAKSMYIYIFDGASLPSGGPTYQNRLADFTTSSNDTFSWAVPAAGAYYIMLTPSGSSSTSDTTRSMTITLNEGDHNEGNDTWQTATELTENVNTYFTLHGKNDVDWFKITTAVPGEAIKLVLSNFNYTVTGVQAYLYAGVELAAGKNVALTSQDFSTNGTLSWKINEPGDYYVRLSPINGSFITRELKVRYELVPGDGNELNDTRETATLLNNNVAMPFTLNGSNDVDWFTFETTTPNQLMYLYINGFETDYSNQIRYYVYDLVDGVLTNSQNFTANINVVGKSFNFLNTGTHYIKVELYRSTPVENELSLRIDLRQSQNDDCEPNDTWQTATPLAYGTSQSFTLPSGTDVDWFSFAVEEPNQTVKVTVTAPSEGSLNYFLYSGADLELKGDGYTYLTKGYCSSSDVHNWILDAAGTYYIKALPYSGNTIFSDSATIRYELIDPDENENNATWKTATALTEAVDMPFTLPAFNETDWFQFTVTEPNQTVKLTFANIPTDGSLSYYLYSGADLVEKGDGAKNLCADYGTGSGTRTYYWMLGDEGTYYIKTEPHSYGIFSDPATVRYELIEPDKNENNGTWKTATGLTEEVDMPFTLPASNDTDWFKLTVAEPNQTLKVTFSNVPSGGSVSYKLYADADLNLKGDSASYLTYDSSTGSGTATYYWMLGDAGIYYINATAYSGDKIFSTPATVRYELIGPDSNERNNTVETATPLSLGAAVWFTLPATNDADWFRLCQLEQGDKLCVTVGSMKAGNSFNCTVNGMAEGETSASQKGGLYFRPANGTQTQTFTVTTAGQYYLRFSDGQSTDAMYVKYSVQRDKVDVTGIQLQTAQETLPVGRTLLLNTSITPYYAADQSVTWSSSNDSVASVDANGVVTALQEGTATITVRTTVGGYTASCKITVTKAIPATGVTITPAFTEAEPKSLALDTGLQLRATVLPEDATEQEVTWTSSDEKVLAVTSYGRVTAVGSGKAYITATTADGGHTAQTWFSVPDETYPVTRITLNRTNLTIYMKEEGQALTATVAPTYATNPSVTWSSSDPAVAAVDQNGVVTAVSQGYATITVTAQENPAVMAECRVSVQPERVRVTGLTFDQASLEVGLYKELTLVPTIAPANATVRNVTWTSSNTTVATVSRTGKVYTVGLGYADITATSEDGGFTATIRINVSPSAQLGDLSGDGYIDAADALLILQSSVGLRALSAEQQALADVSGDGYIDAADAILILRYAAGLIDALPKQ